MTGANGTVGGAVGAAAGRRGWTVIPWDRAAVSPDDRAAIDAQVDRTAPQAILHLAMGAPAWAARMAELAAAARIPFVFTSTVSVFAAPGPHRLGDERTASDDYGRYKIQCEDAVRGASSAATVVRLGYQIDLAAGGNNMGAHLCEQAARGAVLASAEWIPAASMLPDTAQALLDLLASPLPGLHHLDANTSQAWSYPQIVAAIARALDADWRVEITHERVDDQRLLDSLPIAALSERLPIQR